MFKLSNNRIYICPSSNLDLTFLQILNQHVKKYLFKNCVPSFIQFNKIQLISQFLFNQGHGLFNILHWLGVVRYIFRLCFSTFGWKFLNSIHSSVTCSMCITRSTIFSILFSFKYWSLKFFTEWKTANTYDLQAAAPPHNGSQQYQFQLWSLALLLTLTEFSERGFGSDENRSGLSMNAVGHERCIGNAQPFRQKRT